MFVSLQTAIKYVAWRNLEDLHVVIVGSNRAIFFFGYG